MKKFLVASIVIAFFGFAYAQFGFWTYNKKIDPITDKDTSSIINFGKEFGYKQPSLILRCDGKTIREVYINFDEFMNTDSFSVVYRVEKNKPVAGIWNNSTDGTASFMPKEMIKAFVKAVKSGNNVIFRGEDYQGTSHTVAFETKGFNSAIQKLVCFKGY